MTTILGVFDDPIAARRAVDELRASPLNLDDVSIVSRATTSGAAVDNADDVSAGEGAAIGAVWGGLVGLAALLIPGVGPFIAGGALFAALTGAATGAVVGGIAAALIDFSGVPEDEARHYETMVHEGKTLVAVKSREADATEVRRMLAAAGAASLREDQTGMATGPVHVAMYDESGRRVEMEREAGGLGYDTGVTGTSSAAPPVAGSPIGSPTVPGTAASGTTYGGMSGIYDVPTTTDYDTGTTTRARRADDLATGTSDPHATREIPSVENPRVDDTWTGDEGLTTPDVPPMPPRRRDTNLPDPDDSTSRKM